MPMCKILENYKNAEGWEKGDVVDITNPHTLIKEEKVKLVSKEEVEKEIEEAKEEIRGAKNPELAEEMSWKKLRKLASSNDLYKVGMSKSDVIEALEENDLI